jgi:hypothetical protein
MDDWRNSMRNSLSLSALLLALVACTTPYKPPQFNAKPNAPHEFDGVAHLLDKAGTVDVLLVHGMCTHDAAWANEAAENLYATMGGDPSQVNLTPSPVGTTGITLFQQTLALPSGSLRVNAILWSPLTTPLKADLCYDQTVKSKGCTAPEAAKAYPYQRARANRQIKDALLNDCLSDALIYQGKARVEINERMQDAIKQAVGATGGHIGATPDAGSTVPMVIVTDSLGSKVTFDAIFKLASPHGRSKEMVGISLFNRTAQVFMRANQMPILGLADKYLDGTLKIAQDDAGFPADPIQGLIRQRNDKPGPRSSSLPTVVAFSDPNDLLSFALVGSPHAAGAGYPIVDVIVSNDKTYLGFIELPNNAHSDYKKNEDVKQLIACGKPRSKLCSK